MHYEFLAKSPLLALPLGAMFLFLLVWITAAVRIMTRSREEMAFVANLPLEPEGRHERR